MGGHERLRKSEAVIEEGIELVFDGSVPAHPFGQGATLHACEK